MNFSVLESPPDNYDGLNKNYWLFNKIIKPIASEYSTRQWKALPFSIRVTTLKLLCTVTPPLRHVYCFFNESSLSSLFFIIWMFEFYARQFFDKSCVVHLLCVSRDNQLVVHEIKIKIIYQILEGFLQKIIPGRYLLTHSL